MENLMIRNLSVFQWVIDPHSSRVLRVRLHDSMFTGEMKIEEWLRRHPGAMHSHLGVFRDTFLLILHDLETLGKLRATRYISTRNQLGIFLYICREGLGLRHASEAFQRSNDTVSK